MNRIEQTDNNLGTNTNTNIEEAQRPHARHEIKTRTIPVKIMTSFNNERSDMCGLTSPNANLELNYSPYNLPYELETKKISIYVFKKTAQKYTR